jgi:hypothetical protein
MSNVRTQVEIVAIDCITCGIIFGLPEDYMNALKRHAGKNFYCPNGHAQIFLGKSEKQQIKELKWVLEQAELRNRSTEDQLEASERSRASYKGQITKIKNRIKNGICPVCNRSFEDLKNHMDTKHPRFGEHHE